MARIELPLVGDLDLRNQEMLNALFPEYAASTAYPAGSLIRSGEELFFVHTSIPATNTSTSVPAGSTTNLTDDGQGAQGRFLIQIYRRFATAPSTPPTGGNVGPAPGFTVTPPDDWFLDISQTQGTDSIYVSQFIFDPANPVTTPTWGVPFEAGTIGPRGPQGEQGDTGPQGQRGATGAQGPRGATGQIGPRGTQGPQGTYRVNIYLRSASAPATPTVTWTAPTDNGLGTLTNNPLGWSVDYPTTGTATIYQSVAGYNPGSTSNTITTWGAPFEVTAQGPTGPPGPPGSSASVTGGQSIDVTNGVVSVTTIGTGQIADEAVTGPKIENLAVNTGQIAEAAVTVSKVNVQGTGAEGRVLGWHAGTNGTVFEWVEADNSGTIAHSAYVRLDLPTGVTKAANSTQFVFPTAPPINDIANYLDLDISSGMVNYSHTADSDPLEFDFLNPNNNNTQNIAFAPGDSMVLNFNTRSITFTVASFSPQAGDETFSTASATRTARILQLTEDIRLNDGDGINITRQGNTFTFETEGAHVFVRPNAGLEGDGTTGSPLDIRDGGVTRPKLSTTNTGTDGQLLSRAGDRFTWIDSAAGSLSGLTDTDISSPNGGQALVWNSTDDEWVNGQVTATGIANGAVNHDQLNTDAVQITNIRTTNGDGQPGDVLSRAEGADGAHSFTWITPPDDTTVVSGTPNQINVVEAMDSDTFTASLADDVVINAVVSDNTLTLTQADGSTVAFTPSGGPAPEPTFNGRISNVTREIRNLPGDDDPQGDVRASVSSNTDDFTITNTAWTAQTGNGAGVTIEGSTGAISIVRNTATAGTYRFDAVVTYHANDEPGTTLTFRGTFTLTLFDPVFIQYTATANTAAPARTIGGRSTTRLTNGGMITVANTNTNLYAQVFFPTSIVGTSGVTFMANGFNVRPPMLTAPPTGYVVYEINNTHSQRYEITF